MKTFIRSFIDRLAKQRRPGAYALYLFAARVIAAYENRDVEMRSNGEYWLIHQLAARGPMTAIDVGANQGDWAQAVLQLRPDATLICYEPVPTTFENLQRNMGSSNARLVNSGLSSEAGTLTINSVIENPYLSTVQNLDALVEAGFRVEPILVHASTGDAEIENFALQRVTIVKVDAEGHDLEVIKGFGRAISRDQIDIIQFEYNHLSLFARVQLRDFFEFLGNRYLICRLLPAGLEACGYHPVLDNFGQSNWVAVRCASIDATTIADLAIRPSLGHPGLALARQFRSTPDLLRLLKVLT